jgi:osomolarity two-component system response regulator SSK1
VPTASITALYTSLKAIQYISTHLGTLSRLVVQDAEAMSSEDPGLMKREYDIGEMIQRVCDVVAGTAAAAKVEFVLYHADYGFYHQNVFGNEEALCHSLLDVSK